MGKPQASKIVHLCVSVGAEDKRTLDIFEEDLKNLIGIGYLRTVVGATYLHDGKTYRKPDWEAWNGDEATKPRAMFDHSGGPTVVERVVPTHQQKSPAEALAGVKRTPKRARKVVEPEPDWGAPPGSVEGEPKPVAPVESDDDDWGSW